MAGVVFELSLVDKVTAPAQNVAGSFQLAAMQAGTLVKAMQGIEAAGVKAAATGDIAKMRELTATYSTFQTQLKLIEGTFPGVTASLTANAEAAEKAKVALAEKAKATKHAAQEAKDHKEAMDSLTGVLVPFATAAIGVAAVIGALVFKGAELALAASEAKEKMTVLFDALGDGKATGEGTIKMLDDLGDKIGKTRGELAPFARSFMAMGVTGKEQLENLTLAAAAAGTLAEGGGEKFEHFFRKVQAAQDTGAALKVPLKGLGSLADMGLNVNDVANKMGISSKELAAQLKGGTVNATLFGNALQEALVTKGAGPLSASARTLTSQWSKFGENIMRMFEDIDVSGFLDGVREIGNLFSQNTASGQAMKAGIVGAFNALFAAAKLALPYIKIGFELLIIAALEAYIAVKKFYSGEEGAARMHATMSILYTAVGLVAVGLGLVAAAAVATVGAIVWLTKTVVDAITFLQLTAKWAETAGGAIVDGLVNGVKAKLASVTQAAMDIGNTLKNGVKDALKIHSPSLEMAMLGQQSGEGLAQGMQSKQGKVADSSEQVAGASLSGAQAGIAPPRGSGDGTSGGGKGKGGGGSISVGGIHVKVDGGTGSAQEVAQLVATEIAVAFERIALSQGLTVVE